MTGQLRAPARHSIAFIALVLLAALIILVQPVHSWLLSVFERAEQVMLQRQLWGAVLFVVLAALSAMIAFLSSAVLVPVAIYLWGPTVCFLLLWLGWFTGGLAAYGIGRYLGRPVVERLVGTRTLGPYEQSVRSGRSLVTILMVQLALPSDLTAYVFGLVRCRFTIFVTALAVAEVPYALAAVYLGTSFLERQTIPLVLLGTAGVLFTFWAIRRLHQNPPTHDPGAITPAHT
jgi:uncharacterized membrane protein YdjX (TVP38/TMEM64 family)